MISDKQIQTARRPEALMSITGADRNRARCISVEQHALLGRQSATANVGNEAKETNSVSEVPRRKRTKSSWRKDNDTRK